MPKKRYVVFFFDNDPHEWNAHLTLEEDDQKADEEAWDTECKENEYINMTPVPAARSCSLGSSGSS